MTWINELKKKELMHKAKKLKEKMNQDKQEAYVNMLRGK